MGKKTKKFLIELIAIFVITYFLGLVLAGLVKNHFSGFALANNPFDPIALLVCGCSTLLYFLVNLDKIGGGDKNKKKVDQKDDPYFQGKLFEQKDLEANFVCCKFSEIKKQDFKKRKSKTNLSYKGSGILVRNELINNGRDANVCFLPPIHTLVVGNTNTGKSQGFILPSIMCYAEMSTHPNMIISDLKGEIFRDTNHQLVKNGYNVLTFNLRDPFRSDRWNPLEDAYDWYQRAINLKKEVLVHKGSHPSNTKLKFDKNANFGAVWFEFDNYAYANESDLDVAVSGKEQSLYAKITEHITDIMNVIVPLNDPKSAMWTNGAREFAKAILYCMLEDSKYPELGMTKEKFNFYNFYKIINIKDGGDKMFKTLGKYCEGRSKTFNAKELSNQVINTNSETASSFLAELTPNLGLFADPGIAYVTSATDIDFTSFIKKPTALFLRIPDEKETMYKLATIAVTQLYKKLVDFANQYDSYELPIPTYFILDEFANLPKMEQMGKWVAVARSRLIYFLLAVQSYAQLETAYEKSGAQTIKENCNVHIFIGSSDTDTLEEVSKRAGKTSVTVKNENTTESKGGKNNDGGKQVSKSETNQERPLIFAEQLRLLEYENAVVLFDKTPPFYTKLNYTYKFWNKAQENSCYDNQKTFDSYRAPKYLDEEKVFYDINGYIEKTGGNTKNSNKKNIFDDFHFDF